MQILHINCNYVGTTLHQLMIEHLDNLDCKNQVFVPTYDKRIAVIQPNENVCLCECFRKWDRLLFDYKQRKIRNALESNIKVESFDLIHAYTLFTDGNCARRLYQKYKIPYVVAIRNTDVNDFFRLMPHLRRRGVQIMRDAAAVFFLSEAYRKQVFEKYIPEKYREEIQEKSHIIPNGIDEFWFENRPTEKGQIDKRNIKLVYAGRIDRNKNIPTTQKAMKLLRAKGYESTLTVVGKVQDKKEFQRIQLDASTNYLPAMPKEKLIDIYRQSDIFVMPSFTESFGLVYAEAMSQALPVIYTRGQGFDGQFSEGEIGYAVSTASEIADSIMKCVQRYEQLSANAVPACSKFRWNIICEKYAAIYEEIAKNNNGYKEDIIDG